MPRSIQKFRQFINSEEGLTAVDCALNFGGDRRRMVHIRPVVLIRFALTCPFSIVALLLS